MGILGDIFSRITTTIQSQVTALTAFVVQLQNIGTRAAQYAQQKIQRFLQILLKNPQSKKDYWRLFGVYLSKRFVVMSLVVLGVVGYFSIYYAYPWAEGKLWTANVRLDTAKYAKFSGKARVYDSAGVLVYEGSMDKGAPNGEGTQYSSNGVKIYKGGFEGGKYSGHGELYNSDGVMIYNGNFSNNRYEGEGKLSNDIGKVIYIGNFSVGQRSGMGIEYDPDTALKKYYGSYLNNERSGHGVEYEDDGTTIKYEGDFKDGTYGGSGKLYSAGNLLYSGEFDGGDYEGSGTLYDTDTGAVKYAGEFKNGQYNGSGKLYNINTGVIEYEGTFSQGKKQGSGTSYDSLGSETFTGTFRSDSINYISYLGKSPDDVTGAFGKETYRTETDNHLIITYLGLDVSMAFKVDSEKGTYACEKIILGIKNNFMGLDSQSSSVERRKVMGDPYSSFNFSCPDYFKTIFSHLEININKTASVPIDKYIMGKYLVKFYFNDGRTELKCIEISAL